MPFDDKLSREAYDDQVIRWSLRFSDAELLRIRMIGPAGLRWLRVQQMRLGDSPEIGWDGVP